MAGTANIGVLAVEKGCKESVTGQKYSKTPFPVYRITGQKGEPNEAPGLGRQEWAPVESQTTGGVV